MKSTPRERIAAALAAAFRSLSASSDRQLAGEAFKLEPQVLALVRGDKPARKGRGAKNNLNINHA
jgi:hypothetical protein